jgi:hypothetical protein
MKKLMIVLALMFTVMISSAQIATIDIPKGTSYYNYPTDVTLTNNTQKYFVFNIQSDNYTAQAFIVHLDSLAGNMTSCAVNLSGRVSNQTATWTSIGTITWGGTTADTTIIYLNATESAFRQFKLNFTGGGTGTP